MKVKAIRLAFVGGRRIREGAVIDLPEGTPVPSWARPLSGSPAGDKAATRAQQIEAVRVTAGPKRPGTVAVKAGLGEDLI